MKKFSLLSFSALFLVLSSVASSASQAVISCNRVWSYAVEDKLYDQFNGVLSNMDDLSNSALGNRNWKLRKLTQWAYKLPYGCYRYEWINWLNYL